MNDCPNCASRADLLARVEAERDAAQNALVRAVFGNDERAEHLASLVEKMKTERDAEKQRAERWKALATSAECAGCGQPNKGEADWWAGCGDDWHERQREALAAESDATERKT